MTEKGYTYKAYDGRLFYLKGLSGRERKVLAQIQLAYRRRPDWARFTNYWRSKVRQLYRDLPPNERTSTLLYLIGEDLEARLGISQKYFRSSDYRDQLNLLIAERFRSRYAFCRATGLDQGFLSRLVHKSTHISVERLNRALLRIGWELRLARAIKRKSKKDAAEATLVESQLTR